MIVACDGSPDETAAAGPRRRRRRRARAAARGQDPRPGRRRSSAPAARSWRSRTPTRAGSRTRLRRLVAPFADPRVGYVCGEVQLRQRARHQPGGPLLALRDARCGRSSRALRSVTGGNGAIYATRRESYLVVDPIMGHDLSFPFNMVKRGWLALVRAARRSASEKMVPDDRGRVRPQAADDEPRLADRRCAAGCSRRAATARCTR